MGNAENSFPYNRWFVFEFKARIIVDIQNMNYITQNFLETDWLIYFNSVSTRLGYFMSRL